MYTRQLSLAALFVLCLSSAPAVKADEIALWNFNDAVAGGPPSLTVDRGAGTLTTTANPLDLTNFTGTTVNAQMGDPAGRDLAIMAGAGLRNNGSILELRFSTVGFNDPIGISWTWQRSATGFNSVQLQVSVDGTTFINILSVDPPTSFAASSLTLTGAGIGNNPNLALRWVLNGATNAAGNIRFDNLVVTGTPGGPAAIPEPATMLLLGTGLAGIAARRLRRKRSKNTLPGR